MTERFLIRPAHEGDCEFIAAPVAAGPCTAESYTYPPPSYGLARIAQSGQAGLADGEGTGNRLIYGDPTVNGCDTSTANWGQSGSLWVR